MTESPPPIVCTLTTAELARQTIDWTDVRSLALSGEEIPDGARSTFSLADADAIEELAARETDCCGSWLRIEISRADVLTMEITTDNPEGLDLIRAMAGTSE